MYSNPLPLLAAGLFAAGLGGGIFAPELAAFQDVGSDCGGGVPMMGTCMFTESVFGNSPADQQRQQEIKSMPLFKTKRIWGSLVYDAPTHAWSFATAEKKKDEAKEAALAQCRTAGGTGCAVMLTYSNQCAAVARAYEGDKFLPGRDSVNTGTQPEDADQNALASCQSDWGKQCKVVINHCTRTVVDQVR